MVIAGQDSSSVASVEEGRMGLGSLAIQSSDTASKGAALLAQASAAAETWSTTCSLMAAAVPRM